MDEISLLDQMRTTETSMASQVPITKAERKKQRIAEHKQWLSTLPRERPNEKYPFRVGVYIRYFNQTKHENYLDYHKKELAESVGRCPAWELVDFYVDEGASAPSMASAPEWCRLLDDCEAGKVNLIITQKTSSVSSSVSELTLCARLLAARKPPVGIYFISEDIFTLASYYMADLKDLSFFPSPDWKLLPDDEGTPREVLND